MKWVLLAVAALYVLPPVGGWRQESFVGTPFVFPSAVAVCPTANGCWTFTNTGVGNTAVRPTGTINIVPNRQNQWTTITDISVHVTFINVTDGYDNTTGQPYSIYRPNGPHLLVIRDGNTGTVIHTEPLALTDSESRPATIPFGNVTYQLNTDTYSNTGGHLTTPIVLDRSGSNPPTLEIVPSNPDVPYVIGNPGTGVFTGNWLFWPIIGALDVITYTVSFKGRYVYNN